MGELMDTHCGLDARPTFSQKTGDARLWGSE